MTRNTVNNCWTVSSDSKCDPHGTLKQFEVSSVSIPDLSSLDTHCSQYTLDITLDRLKRLVGRGCPIELFRLLINSMMNIPATITKDRFGKFSVFVDTFYHMKRHIDEAIQTMIDRSFSQW